MKHKEYGSEFYQPIGTRWCTDTRIDSIFTSTACSLFFSGRAALYQLLNFGITNHGWQDVYLPSYYCHEVYRFIKPLPIEVHYYPFNPESDPEIKIGMIPDRSECVMINVSFFGMPCPKVQSLKETIVIEDLTHRLASVEYSMADYCFGSLRKELPLPVGGFVVAPGGNPLPTGVPSKVAERISEEKLKAMRLKFDYLKGLQPEKDTYRELFKTTELEFESELTRAAMPRNTATLLTQLNVNKILNQKQINLKHAIDQLSKNPDVTLFESPAGRPSFGLLLRLASKELRDALAHYLIDQSIYPAVLWPDQIREPDKDLEDRLLFVHTDFRYDIADITVITKTLQTFFEHA